jgi:hypothetical protein
MRHSSYLNSSRKMKGYTEKRGKSWRYQVDIGADPATGNRRRRSAGGFKTQRAATQAMRDELRRVEGGETLGAPTLAGFVTDEWLPSRRAALKPSTWASYRDVLEGRVLPRIGALRLDRITPAASRSSHSPFATRVAGTSAVGNNSRRALSATP